jgi:plastocyanin domain-containing protein
MLTSSSTAGTAVVAYAVPANMQAAVTINCVGLVRSTINVFIAPASGTLADANKIERNLTLDVGQVLERSRIVLPAGYRLLVSSDVASAVAVQVWGIEEAV